MATIKKTDLAASYTTCSNGLTANYPATQSWVFETKTYTRGDLLNMLQAAITASQNTKAAHDAWLAAVASEQTQLATTKPVLASLHKSLEAQWGATSTKMAEFGYEPEKPPVRTAASKAAAVAKAKATRAAKKAALATVTTTGASPAPASPAATTPAPVPPKTA
ncbi:MAG TPA: hypothetical protein VGL81_14090 [Polyangiaceae bacterium]|jgi:hypothetical protein